MIKKGNGTAAGNLTVTPPTSRTGTRAPSSAARTCYSDTPTVPRAGAGVLAHLGVVPRRRPAHLGVVYGRMPIWYTLESQVEVHGAADRTSGGNAA